MQRKTEEERGNVCNTFDLDSHLGGGQINTHVFAHPSTNLIYRWPRAGGIKKVEQLEYVSILLWTYHCTTRFQEQSCVHLYILFKMELWFYKLFHDIINSLMFSHATSCDICFLLRESHQPCASVDMTTNQRALFV